MKKIATLAVVLAFSVFAAKAQVVVPTEQQQQQQQALQQQQQAEQQQLLEQQQAEQQKLLEQQQKEQEKAAKAEQKEQDRIAKEEARAEAQAKKEAKRQRREEIGRGTGFSIDPIVSVIDQFPISQYENPYHQSQAFMIGAKVAVHYPLSKKWDFVGGLGFNYNNIRYTNSIIPNSDATDYILNPVMEAYDHYASLAYTAIELPLTLNNMKHGWYVGLNLCYNLNARFSYQTLGSNGEYASQHETDMLNINKLQIKVVLGFDERMFILNPGVELFYNLLPTYNITPDGFKPIHQFGLSIQL